ncbi:hypothetical protein PSU4_03770 [Pseudonocardia sulfidoxydans NBRC 16205]|uniref:Multi-component regulatory system-8 n=1 Tax=Pseudonocardia sulfidoxydans NBRC 16205 TaxID=1223511 RepID=A0A511DAM3_9PSEU|nr:hypothetical protein PSU4_03770 [Pseudonocardia sulfidoxydans NBRC 16205]
MPDHEPDDGGPVVGRTGARFGGAPRRRREARARQPVADEPVTVPISVVEPDLPADGSGPSVRPYMLTGGRTRAPVELGLETLVGVRPDAGPTAPSPAHRAVLDRCRVPCSVAEVAATTGVPLGVVRVLIGDVVVAGTVQVHGPATAAPPEQGLLARVVDGLRRL